MSGVVALFFMSVGFSSCSLLFEGRTYDETRVTLEERINRFTEPDGVTFGGLELGGGRFNGPGGLLVLTKRSEEVLPLSKETMDRITAWAEDAGFTVFGTECALEDVVKIEGGIEKYPYESITNDEYPRTVKVGGTCTGHARSEDSGMKVLLMRGQQKDKESDLDECTIELEAVVGRVGDDGRVEQSEVSLAVSCAGGYS